MKKNWIIILFSVFVAFSCEEKDFDFVLGMDNNFEYTVTGNGFFNESYTVTEVELSDMVDDIESDLRANMKQLDIEMVLVKLVGNPGNTAAGVILASTIQFDESEAPEILFENITVPVVSEDDSYLFITNFTEATVSKLVKKYEAIVRDSDYSEFTVNAFGLVQGGSLDAELEIVVRISMVSTSSFEVPRFIGD